MRSFPSWPQWLSVPGAPARVLADQTGSPRVRLLHLVADHGVARPRPRAGDGTSSIGHGVGSSLAAFDLALRAVDSFPHCMEMTEQIALGAEEPAFYQWGSQRLHEDCHDRFPTAGVCHDRGEPLTQSVLDLGRHDPVSVDPTAQRFDLGPGTVDSRLGPAMDNHQLDLALSAGRHAVERAKLDCITLIQAQGTGAGAMTTNQVWRQILRRSPATFIAHDPGAILAFVHGLRTHRARCHHQLDVEGRSESPAVERNRRRTASNPIEGSCGGGGRSMRRRSAHAAAATCAAEAGGVDAGLILGRHATDLSSPYEALRCIGGFEHAALVGSALAAAQLGLQWEAVGESAVIARLLALWLNPSVKPWLQTGSSWFSCACGGRSE